MNDFRNFLPAEYWHDANGDEYPLEQVAKYLNIGRIVEIERLRFSVAEMLGGLG